MIFKSVAELKRRLVNGIQATDDKHILEAMFELLPPQEQLTEDEQKQLATLQEREQRYRSGESKAISLEEFRSHVKSKYDSPA